MSTQLPGEDAWVHSLIVPPTNAVCNSQEVGSEDPGVLAAAVGLGDVRDVSVGTVEVVATRFVFLNGVLRCFCLRSVVNNRLDRC